MHYIYESWWLWYNCRKQQKKIRQDSEALRKLRGQEAQLETEKKMDLLV